ncbi:tripartite tricarboxylate transporter substrate binding protein, partial [Vibrio parahaemolyticus]|nr:tripartite tricarboxylate transporter substrate binding protein [Vibrio parahaemolyticus]
MTHALLNRRTLSLLLAAGGVAGPALAQPERFPSRPIKVLIGFTAGGSTDVPFRVLAENASKILGQPVIIENKPGAGATLGADYVAKAKADGYTLLMGAVHHTIATSVYRKLGYDFEKDFAPITTVALVPNVLVVNPQLPAKTVQELLAQAKA